MRYCLFSTGNKLLTSNLKIQFQTENVCDAILHFKVCVQVLGEKSLSLWAVSNRGCDLGGDLRESLDTCPQAMSHEGARRSMGIYLQVNNKQTQNNYEGKI